MYAEAIKRLWHVRIPAISGGPAAWIGRRLRRPVGVAAAKPQAPADKGDVSLFSRDQRLLAAVLIISIAALATNLIAVRNTERGLLEAETSATAIHWARFIQEHLSELDEILSDGLVSARDQRVFDFASQAGRIIRYEVIRPDGVIALSSWAGDFRKSSIDEHLAKVKATGKPLVILNEDSGFSNEVTVEGAAYVPMITKRGISGVIKVYVDMTERALALREIGDRALLALSGLLAIFGAFLSFFVWRNIRGRNRELEEVRRSRTRIEQAQNTIRALSQRNEMILNAAGEGIYGLDMEGRTTFINPAAARMIGWQPEQLIGEPQHAILHHTKPDGSPYPKEACPIYAAFRDGTEHHVSDEVFWRQDGTSFPVEYTSTPIRNDSGELTGAVVVFKDITERKRQERELTKKSTILGATLDSMDQGISLVDADLNIAVYNRRCAELLDLPPERFRPGDPFEAVIRYNAERGEYGPGDVDELTQARVELAKRFEAHRFERTRPDGTVIDIHGTPLPGGGFVTTYTDITERKWAEDELRGSEERYSLAVQAINEGVYDWRISSGEVHYSDRVRAVLGLSPEELSTSADWLERIHPEDKKKFEEALVAHFKGETDRFEFEFRYRAASGEWRWACQHGVALRDNDGWAYRMAGSIGDITNEKRAEEALIASEHALQERVTELEEAQRTLERQGADLVRLTEDLTVARDHAEAANRAKSEFLAAMSHELRTPLNAIIGFSDVMRSETFGPIGNSQYLDYLGDINDSGQHLLDLINDILDLSKIESGEGDLNEESTDVAEVVESVLRLVQRRAVQGRVEVVPDLPDSLPSLRADQRKLKQILVNLLINAIKFSDAGGKVTLKAWCHPDSGYVFQIVDTGIGIALEEIPKALAPFQQLDGDLDRKYEGTGLGLPLAKSLVELHGGSLDLQSQVGVGTTVTVRFPAERVVQVSDDTPALACRRRAAG